MEKIVISIGSFTTNKIKEYLSKGFKVIAYDPRRDVYEEYLKIEDAKFFPNNAAVVTNELLKEVILKIIKARKVLSPYLESDWYMGSTIHCDKEESFETSPEFSGIVDEYPVKAVSIRSILERYKKIEELHLLCEGEEIPIILRTPIDLLLRCKMIVASFPWNYPHLHLTEAMEKRCIDRLSMYFRVERILGNHSYKFDRKI